MPRQSVKGNIVQHQQQQHQQQQQQQEQQKHQHPQFKHLCIIFRYK